MIRPVLLISLVFAANVARAQEAAPQDVPAAAPAETIDKSESTNDEIKLF